MVVFGRDGFLRLDLVREGVFSCSPSCSVCRLFDWDVLIRHIARTFLSMESRIIGLRFDSGPLGFPGFCGGVKMPSFISLGYSPVFDISFRILVISFGVSSPLLLFRLCLGFCCFSGT